MSFIFEEVVFYDEFTGTGGGGLPYPNHGVLAKGQAWITGHFYLAYLDKALIFNAAERTITNNNPLDFGSFKDDGNNVGAGLKAGRTIAVEGTGSNDGTYEIESISEDGRTIKTVEALVNETIEEADIFDDTIIEAIDLSTNFIENNSEESYSSLTDKASIQRFTAGDLYDSGGGPSKMLVSSRSFGWVPNELTDVTTGETDEVTVEAIEVVDHKQRFLIKQTFRLAPFALIEQIQNITNINPPDYFTDGRALKYICKVDGKFDIDNPEIPHTGSFTETKGLTNWFNQNNIRARAEYYFESIEYLDQDLNELTAPDIDKVVSAAITIRSRNSKFHNVNQRLAVDFVYFPLNESRYIFTPDTTLRQNFLNDRRFLPVETMNNGEYYGTPYQVLENVNPVFVNDSTIRVELDVNFSTEIKEFLKTLEQGNRNFFFCITTQDSAIVTTRQSDNVPILVPINQIEWDKSEPSLFEAVDDLRVYHFPNIDTNPKATVSGWEGDPVYLQLPFLVESLLVGEVAPKILSAGFQIVVTKEGEENFVLEEKIFDTSNERQIRGLGGVYRQTIDISESKNYRDMPDEYNLAALTSDSFYNDGTMAGFLMHYAFVLRYDFWNKLVANSERFQYDIFRDIESPSEAWNTLQQEGWALQVRFAADIQGYEDFSETFEHYWDIDCKAVGDPPDEGPIFESTVEYIDFTTELQTNGITPGGKTLIKRTYTGDFSSMPSGYEEFFAYIFADLENIGGVNTKRFASTEFDSEADNPFSAPEADPDADHSWASANVRIDIFNFASIVVSTIYDDSTDGLIFRNNAPWSRIAPAILLYPRLGAFGGCFVKTEAGGYVLNEKGNRILLETCEDDTSS